MINLLSTFEKVGLKKIPERMKVLKEMKDRIEGDLCSTDELLQVVESYPKTLKNKVSKQMSTLALQKLAPIEEE